MKGIEPEKIKSIMRNFVKAINQKDKEKALSFLADDVDWTNNEGTFTSKEEISRYISWVFEVDKDQTINEARIDIIVEGNKAVYEHRLEGIVEGMKYQIPALCVYEFSKGKIQHIRSISDRLSLAKQVAKGVISKKVVNSLVSRMERGLH